MTGVQAAIQVLNTHYLQPADKITNEEIDDYLGDMISDGVLSNAKEAINTQAWILHMMNPSEAWANLRRSDYPVLMDRTQLSRFDFSGDEDMHTPTRLKYPTDEKKYNYKNYTEALRRNSDNWHRCLWWDLYDINVK